jgi:GH15 family glucan-1,4-alpha-glucosidase
VVSNNDYQSRLNDQLKQHMKIIAGCTIHAEPYGQLLLATPQESRYPYIYPRDTSCAVQLFRRIAGSEFGYDSSAEAYTMLECMAKFIKDVQSQNGAWGQRYGMDGEDKSIYKQEDNVAHGISILCNYLLTALRTNKTVSDLEGYLYAINKGLEYSIQNLYQKELNLFYSTTSIHESSIEHGYTCWVNFAFLYAFSLAQEVSHLFKEYDIISDSHIAFRKHFLYSISELFMSGSQYIRRIDTQGNMDFRPDFTLLSPYYFGFLHYKAEMENSVRFLEKQLWDPELGMIMRYLPFDQDFATHIHAGNGPWLQYTSILAQYHYWNGNSERGDQLLRQIDHYANERGEIPEHLSTCKRFEVFMEKEWKTGKDFEKEFYKGILLDNVDFNKILEETNNMSESYKKTGSKCMIEDLEMEEGGYIQFASPLMWSHVEYAKALLIKAGDWWKL